MIYYLLMLHFTIIATSRLCNNIEFCNQGISFPIHKNCTIYQFQSQSIPVLYKMALESSPEVLNKLLSRIGAPEKYQVEAALM